MAEESITLGPRAHDKLGIYHCGVTREGFVTAAGEVSDIEDGKSVTFERSNITVTRKGEEYTFTKPGTQSAA